MCLDALYVTQEFDGVVILLVQNMQVHKPSLWNLWRSLKSMVLNRHSLLNWPAQNIQSYVLPTLLIV